MNPKTILTVLTITCLIGCSGRKDRPLTNERLLGMLGTKITAAYLATEVTKVEGGFLPRANATKECTGIQIEKLLTALVPFSVDVEDRFENADIYVLYIGGKDPTAFVLQMDDDIIRFKRTNSPFVYRCQNGQQFMNALQTLERQIASNPTWEEARK